MRFRPAIIITILFIPLVIAIIYYLIQLNPTLRQFFYPKNQVLQNKQLIQKMKTYKSPQNENLNVANAIENGDRIYGGNMIKGVLTGVSDKIIPIKTKEGKEIAKSLVTLEITYLDTHGVLQKISLCRIIGLPDGSTFVLDVIPYFEENAVAVTNWYNNWFGERIGTIVIGNFHASKDNILKAIKDAQKSAKDITNSEKVFTVIEEYEKSWDREHTQLILGGDKGKLELLFPIFYVVGSFNPEYGTFNINTTQ